MSAQSRGQEEQRQACEKTAQFLNVIPLRCSDLDTINFFLFAVTSGTCSVSLLKKASKGIVKFIKFMVGMNYFHC
jgi:hypothetical protein